MKRLLLLLMLFLLLPCLCGAQDIFLDYHAIGSIDQTLCWVLTDPNGIKYKGSCDIALDLDPNAYVQAHMAEWLAMIYTMNMDPNIPDWTDSHMGKYRAGLEMISGVDTYAEVRAVMRKMLKAVYPVVGLPD